MKIRKGFVSNSSSSSFLIGTNEESLEKTLTEEFTKLFPAEGITKEFIEAIAEHATYEMFCHTDYDTKTWSCLASVRDHYLNEYYRYDIEHRDQVEEDIINYKDLFENWKYVHHIAIPDRGCGGTSLSSALRATFPREYKSENMEIKLECDG